MWTRFESRRKAASSGALIKVTGGGGGDEIWKEGKERAMEEKDVEASLYDAKQSWREGRS
jgi:hypothetical protein